MVSFIPLFLIVLAIFALCFLGMAVGILIRNKGFTTCGNATLKGEKVSCPSCEQRGEGAPAPKWCKKKERVCDDG